MAYPEPTEVAPWYLRNITQALALDETTGNVYVRTGITGDVIIEGNVIIPGNVDAHIVEMGNIPLSGNTLPVTVASGNITVDTITGNVTVTQGTSPWVVSGNVGVTGNVNANVTGNVSLSGTGNVSIVDSYEMNIAQGHIVGQSGVFKSGYNPSIANNNEESLWGASNLYPWSTWGAGGTLSCVSSDAGDTGQLQITGLRSSDWVQITETVTMTGTTPVVTSNSFIRINSLHYGDGSTNAGAISVNRGATAVGYILAGLGLANASQFTVPAGYTAYVQQGTANMGKGNDGTGYFKYRLYGGSFQTAIVFLLYQSTFTYQFKIPLALPEKTDLDVTMLASVSGTACSCAYDIILVAN